MRKVCSAIALLSLVLFSSVSSMARSGSLASSASVQIPDASHADPISTDPQFPDNRVPKSEAQIKAEKQLEKERQKQRWQDIKRRSEQLLELATELKQYVDKSGENVMSVEVIKKAEQMEKLSKELQKKMKGD